MQRYRRKDGITFGELHGEWLAVDGEAGFCYSLNQTGIFVWNLLARPVSEADICREMAAAFEVTVEDCAEDVGKLLADLLESGLILREEVDGSRPAA